jgi:hypothetical protein
MPLTLRVNEGDCIQIHLSNKLRSGRASFSAPALAFDPKDSLGANAGQNPGDQTIAPGESRTYTYYADPSLGEIASLVWDWGNVLANPRNGLFGAIIVGPKGAQYREPKTGGDLSLKNSWIADVIVDRRIPGKESRANYRDAVLFFQDEDNIFGTSFMPYIQNPAGLIAVNYRSEPYKVREDQGCSIERIFMPCNTKRLQDPSTPLIEAHVGDPVRLHVFGAGNERNGVFVVEGHEWPSEPTMRGADMLTASQFSGSETVDIMIPHAGGPGDIAGDYTWRNQRLAFSQAGQWGIFRVLPRNDQRILPLSTQQAYVAENYRPR